MNYARDAFEFIKDKKVTAYAFDISGFFENLDHQKLIDALKRLLKVSRLSDAEFTVIKNLTNYHSILIQDLENGLSENEKYKSMNFEGKICSIEVLRELIKAGNISVETNKSGKGIPQGSPISGLLAKLYMLGLDKTLYTLALEMNYYYARYSDDIVLIGAEDTLQKIKIILEEELKKIDLIIKSEKTNITYFEGKKALKSICYIKDKDTGAPIKVENIINPKFEYLGCEFDGKNMRLKSATLSRFYQKLSYRIKKYRFAKNGRKIILRKFGYPGKNNTRNFGRYIQTAMQRGMSPYKIKNQYRNHIKYINNGFKLPKNKIIL